jgi:hypothetical protein
MRVFSHSLDPKQSFGTPLRAARVHQPLRASLSCNGKALGFLGFYFVVNLLNIPHVPPDDSCVLIPNSV